jgi:hypothetical protein
MQLAKERLTSKLKQIGFARTSFSKRLGDMVAMMAAQLTSHVFRHKQNNKLPQPKTRSNARRMQPSDKPSKKKRAY